MAANSLPIVTPDFEGAQNDKGLRYVVRKNKLIAILKDGHVEYAPEGIAFVDAIEPTSFSIGDKVYNVPAGITYVELGLTAPITGNDMYQKVLYQNAGIRGFGLYLDGSKNTSLGSTFALAADLEWLDISGMDTKAVTFGISIFNKNTKLRKIYGKWQLPNVELASNAFISCSALEEVDVSEAGMGKCRDSGSMFNGCSSLTTLDVSGWDTAACTTMGGMFYGCSSLTTLDVSGWDTSACTNMSYMFRGCSSLTTLDVSGWDTAACTTMDSMFNGCSSLTALDVSSWNTAACTNMSYMFSGCSSLKSITLRSPNNPMLTNIIRMFTDAGLESVDLDDFDVSAVTTMVGSFSGCHKLREIIIPNWHAPNLTDSSVLFAYSDHLERVDISGLTMDKVTSTFIMFFGNTALTSLKFPNMGQLKADTDNNKTINLSSSPLDRASLDSIFSYDRTANGLTNTLTVQLSAASKALLTAEEIAAITAKGYTIA